MARVMVRRVVRGQGREIVVQKFPQVAPRIIAGAREATATQLRVLAEETRQLIVDRLFAASPQPPGTVVVSAPGWFKRTEIPGVQREPLRYAKLSKAHAKRKVRRGLDGRFLIEAGDYLDGIEVVKGRGEIPSWIVRPEARAHEGADPSSERIMLSLLARAHEFGSRKRKIPPRPHWRPAARAIQGRFKQLRADVKAEALRAALRRVS